jgi:hypothetical protein
MYKELFKVTRREEPKLNEYVGPLNKTIGEVETQGHQGVGELDRLIALPNKVSSESFRQ